MTVESVRAFLAVYAPDIAIVELGASTANARGLLRALAVLADLVKAQWMDVCDY